MVLGCVRAGWGDRGGLGAVVDAMGPAGRGPATGEQKVSKGRRRMQGCIGDSKASEISCFVTRTFCTQERGRWAQLTLHPCRMCYVAWHGSGGIRGRVWLLCDASTAFSLRPPEGERRWRVRSEVGRDAAIARDQCRPRWHVVSVSSGSRG